MRLHRRGLLSSRTDVAIAALPVALLCGMVATISVSGVSESQSPVASAPVHTLRVVFPAGPEVPPADSIVNLEIDGRAPIRLSSAQPVAIPLLNEALPVRFRYSNGLQLATIVRGTDRELVLPGIRTARVTVQDTDGHAIPGATLKGTGSAGRFSWMAEVTVDVLGLTLVPFPANAAGTATLSTSAPRFGTRRQDMQLATAKDLKVTLEAGSAVRGTIITSAGASTGHAVQVWRLSANRQVGPELIVRREVDRDFVLENLAAGDYELDFIAVRAGMRKVGPLTLKAGTEAVIGEIDLSRSAALIGEIRDEAGKGMAGVRVRLYYSGLPSTAIPQTVSDTAGRFELTRLVPGEYSVELYSSAIGWQTFPDEALLVQSDQSLSRTFRFSGTGCAVRLDVDPEPGGEPATYGLTLPVTDQQVLIEVKARAVQKHIASVPCAGPAFIQRLGANFPRHALTLGPGELQFLVPRGPRATRDIQLLVGGQAFTGAAVWAVPRNSREVVHRSYGSNVTDGTGRAIVPMSAEEDLILYISRGQLTLVVADATFSRRAGILHLDLPDRHITGVARDERGEPVSGVSFGGTLRQDPRADDRSSVSAVTIFKGVTGADGTFSAYGLAPGVWDLALTKPTAQPSLAFRTQVELPPARKGTTTVNTQLAPGR